MNDTLESKPKARTSFQSILLIAAFGAATAIGLGAMALPDHTQTTPPAVGGQPVPHVPGVSYTLVLP